MKPKNIAPLAFALGCCTAAIATFGFLFEQGSRISSIRRLVGDHLMVIELPGFAIGAAVKAKSPTLEAHL